MVAAITMGYGHLRAAAALADHWRVPLELADRPPLCPPAEQRVWGVARRAYHGLSRWSQTRVRGSIFEPALDRLTAIDSGSGGLGSSLPVALLDALIRLGLGRRLARRLEDRAIPLVATFYANAIAAERHGAECIALVVTDSDIHRIWAPRNPAETRIHFLVPADSARRRLSRYGVPNGQIHLTGFPLPGELVGGDDLGILDANLARRIARLTSVRNGAGSAPRIVFSVGGAGTRSETGRRLLRELGDDLRRNRLRLTLSAGTHAEIAGRFRRWRSDFDLDRLAPGTVEILYHSEFGEAYRRFNRTLADADILWTKPGELVFYGALGLPLVLEPPVGAHEVRNRDLVVSAGVGWDRPTPGTIASWIAARLDDGWFVRAAEHGRRELPATGTSAIAAFVSTKLNNRFTHR
jgi:hypothetical protein